MHCVDYCEERQLWRVTFENNTQEPVVFLYQLRLTGKNCTSLSGNATKQDLSISKGQKANYTETNIITECAKTENRTFAGGFQEGGVEHK